MIVFAVILVFILLMGAFTLMYQVFKLVTMDAESRGLKHPKFWGVFSMGGNNGVGGLLLYLIGRKKYVSNMSDANKEIFNSRKRRAGISLCFFVFGAIGLFAIMLFGNI